MSGAEQAKALFFAALDSLDAGDLAAAESKLRAARALVPDNPSILTNLAVVLLQQDKAAEARACAAAAVAGSPGNVEALLVLAHCDGREGQLEAALDAYDRIIALDAGIAETHNNRGLILERLGRYADALESYDRALALDRNLHGAQINRGNALHQLRRFDEALAAYDEALSSSPPPAEALLGRGNVLLSLRRADDALAAFDQALASNGDLAQAWLGRGNALCRLKRHEDALDAYARASAAQPAFAEPWLNRGNALCDLKRHDEALAAYDRALALAPNMAAAFFGRGNVHYDRKQFAAAVQEYDSAIARDPSLTDAWVGRADALRQAGQREPAIEAYHQALARGADPAPIGYYLAAMGAEPLPPAPPQDYVANLFDSYAETFDHDLVENLKYRGQVVVAEAVSRGVAAGSLDILDLGCGTGLAGELMSALKRSMTGVDLSANMLDKARARGIYDDLHCSDIVRFLQDCHLQDPPRMFDAVTAADVFVYIGELSAVFDGVRRVLRGNGLFAFTVEGADTGDFVLRSTLRYAHSPQYLHRLAEQHHFVVETLEPQVIRHDKGAALPGYLAVLRPA